MKEANRAASAAFIPGRKALSAVLLGSTALALSAPAAFAQAQGADSAALEEVVVTATRQTSTVNRVPLSVSAVTQQTMDRQGTKTVVDLQRTVPALRVTQSNSNGVADFSIRGVTAQTGAATTGLYIDDTPVQKRSIVGGGQSGTGTPVPPLFDLERVEVLRGPQGTLYGGSSQGGTIRFITPQPSLTRYSGYVRAEASRITASKADGGDPNYEAGVAVGGPIVRDKLGFRGSIFAQHMGGYVDVVDPYNNGALRFDNANSYNTTVGRLALAWAPTERSLVTLAYYRSHIRDKGGPSNWLTPQAPGQTYTGSSPCFDTRVGTGRPPPAITCPASAVAGQTVGGIFKRPFATYGPFDYLQRPYQSFAQSLSPATANLKIISLTLDYNFDKMNVKSITSYIHDENLRPQQAGGTGGEYGSPLSTTDNSAGSFALSAAFPNYGSKTPSINKRFGLVEEIRFSNSNQQSRLNWVAGFYVSRIRAYAEYNQLKDTEKFAQLLYGMTSTQAFGAPYIGYGVFRSQPSRDFEVAGFGEATFSLTDKFKLIAGVRVSQVEFEYTQIYFGSVPGFNDPKADDRGITQGRVVETPVTPKFGAQYQLTDNDMLYVNAAKGYRAGGVNPPPSAVLCRNAFAALGLTINDIPKTYDSDTVWSYEAGSKFRLFNGRMQLNSSVYRIDWKDLQQGVSLGGGCAPSPNWTQNSGRARSQGFDVEAQARLFTGLTANLAVGYTHAVYSETTTAPKPLNGAAPIILLRKGDPLPVAPWQVSVGAEYAFGIGKTSAYVRGDVTYSSDFQNGPGPGLGGYAPDIYLLPSVTRVNVRAGVNISGTDVNLFVNNLFNNDHALSKTGGRSSCSAASGAACTSYTTLDRFPTVDYGRPRTVGVQASRRF